MSDAASAATLTGGLGLGCWWGDWNFISTSDFHPPAAAASPYPGERAKIAMLGAPGSAGLKHPKPAATKALRNRKLIPTGGRGSKLTSACFHHKFRLRQAYGATGTGRFISDREINAGSAFQFDSNLILIGASLVTAT
jgi:hypothetical protein